MCGDVGGINDIKLLGLTRSSSWQAEGARRAPALWWRQREVASGSEVDGSGGAGVWCNGDLMESSEGMMS